MSKTFQPRPGSRTELAFNALGARGAMSALALSDVIDCDQKQLPGILAAAIAHGRILRDEKVKPFMYFLAPVDADAPPPRTFDKRNHSPTCRHRRSSAAFRDPSQLEEGTVTATRCAGRSAAIRTLQRPNPSHRDR